MTQHKASRTRLLTSFPSAMAITAMLGCSPEDRQVPRPEPASHEVEPALPVAPALPLLSPCPKGFRASVDSGSGAPTCELEAMPAQATPSECAPGWSLVSIDDVKRSPLEQPVMVCKPPLPPARCPDGQRVDTESGLCVTVGTACPAPGAWPSATPAGNVLYVRAGAAGTGTKASPLGTLDAALAKASDGHTIVLAGGTYKGAFVIARPLSIVGTCPQQVIIEGPVSTKLASDADPTSIEGTFDVRQGGNLTLRDLTVRGQRHGLHVQPGAVATVSGTRFDQNTDRAILVQGGTLTLRDAVVERTLPRLDGTKGRGLQVNFAGNAQATDVTFQDNDRGEATAFTVGSSLAITDCLLQNTRAEGDGYGIIAAEGATVSVTTSAIQRKKARGVHVSAGTATLKRVSVANLDVDASGNAWGAYVGQGGNLSAEDSFIHHTAGFGIMAEGEGTNLSLVRSSVAMSTTNLVENALGRAVGVQDGARATLDTVFLGTNSESGLSVRGASVTGSDLTLQGNEAFGAVVEMGGELELTRVRSVADLGVGIIARRGGKLLLRDASIEDPIEVLGRDGASLGIALMVQESTATLERVSVHHSQGAGFHFEQSTVDGTDLVIEDTLSAPAKLEAGVGMYVHGGAVSVHGLLVRRALMAGIYAGEEPTEEPAPETMLSGSDVVVEDVRGQEKDGSNGMGVVFHAGARGSLERVRVSRARTGSIVVMEKGEVTLSDLIVEDTQSGSGSGAVGYGMYLDSGAHVTLNRGRVQGSHAAGVLLNGNGASLEASDLTIEGTAAVDGQDGIGLRVVGGAAVKLRKGAVLDSHAVGVLLQFAGVLDAEDLLVSQVATGSLTSEDTFGRQTIDDVGSCLLATARSNVTLSRTRLDGCSLGALFDDSEGTLDDTQVDGAELGLAIQGFPEPMVQWEQVGLTTNDTPLNYRESDFPVPASPPPGLSPQSPSSSVVRAD